MSIQMSRLVDASGAPARVARVNLDAFAHNVGVLSRLAAPAKTMLAVKADAYGHGMVVLARTALESGASSLAVLDIPAALTLREAGITAPIFAWMHAPNADFGAAARANIDLGISAVWQLDAIAAAGTGHAPRVHLKIDTGLHRNGATVEQWPGLVTAALEADRAGTVRLFAAWSHLADASPADDAVALGRFRDAVRVAEGLGARFEMLHLAASSAGIRMPEAHLDQVRFGIAAYGITPFDDETALELGLRPVMTLAAPIVSTKRVAAGQGVSYGFDYRTTRETTLALVPLGYADGVPRAANGRGEVYIAGRRYPVAGRIAMDQIVVDVGDAPVKAGDEVIVFGEGPAAAAAGAVGAVGAAEASAAEASGTASHSTSPVQPPTAEEWAGWARTIGDEIVARIGPRVPREYVFDEGPWVVDGPDEMHAFGRRFAARLGAGDLLVLTGELGAGKTTFTRGLGEGLGVRGTVTSPTFVLARTHPNSRTGVPLVHVDAYRLGTAAELDDLDIDFENSIVVVEWGAGMIDRLSDSFFELVIDRPRGEGAMDASAAVAGSGTGTPAAESTTPDAHQRVSPNTDADLAEPVEPRTVTLHHRKRVR